MISACCMLYGVSLDIVNKLQEIKDFGYLWKELWLTFYNTGIIKIVTMAL